MRLPRYYEPGIATIRDVIEEVDVGSAAEATKLVLAELNRVLWAAVPNPSLKAALEDVRHEMLQLVAALCAVGDDDAWIERQHTHAAVDRLVKVLVETEPNELTKVLDAA